MLEIVVTTVAYQFESIRSSFFKFALQKLVKLELYGNEAQTRRIRLAIMGDNCC